MEVEDLMNLEGDTIMLEPSISTLPSTTTQPSPESTEDNNKPSRSNTTEPKPFLTSYKTNKLLSEKALGKQPEPSTFSSSSSSILPQPSTTTSSSNPTRKIPKLNLTKSAKLALLSSSSTQNDTLSPALLASTSTSTLSPLNEQQQSSSSLLFPTDNTTGSLSPILPLTPLPEDPSNFFLAPSGRSLRARTGIRPSYLEIPPSSITSLSDYPDPPSLPPLIPIASTSSTTTTSSEEKTASELLQVSGRLVKRFKKWDKQRKKNSTTSSSNGKNRVGNNSSSDDDGEKEEEEEEGEVKVQAILTREKNGGGNKRRRKNSSSSNNDSSELSSTTEEPNKGKQHSRKKKQKKRTKTNIHGEGYDRERERDSSPLSSISSSRASSPTHSQSSLASSSLSTPQPEEETTTTTTNSLPFPNKSKNHPLNKIFKSKPTKPPLPPDLKIFKQHESDLNRFSWIEGLREITLGGEIVQPTYTDDEEDAESEQDGEGNEKEKEKKKPSWEWAEEIVATPTIPIQPPQGSSLAHPPPATNTGSPSKSTSFLSVPVTSSSLPLSSKQQSLSSSIPAVTIVPRPKTYRQIARLDWSDFQQRHKCRFTTSGSIEGVNPESFNWEDWYGIEDEQVSTLRRGRGSGGEEIESSLKKKNNKSGLIIFTTFGLNALGGLGSLKDFEKTCWEDESFQGGFEWNNGWRFKTLEEGMGRCWEEKCRWAIRNPERKYLSDSSSEEEDDDKARGGIETEQQIRERLEAERRQRKRERKKAKRERERKEREGSGGESELTPLEGEELSTDSDETEEEVVLATMSAAAIARKSSLIMQQAADAHAASGKAGVMVRCPLPGCPQRFYRSKASSSAATHHRHYHTNYINIKYASSGVSAYVERNDQGDFVCPAPGCGFATKSRGTFAVHGKPLKGNCPGPPESIPKPKKKGKKVKVPFVEPIPIAPTPGASRSNSLVPSQGPDQSDEDEDEDEMMED